MDCFKHSCPFRRNPIKVNESHEDYHCKCIACPNRCSNTRIILSDHTLIGRELEEIEKGVI